MNEIVWDNIGVHKETGDRFRLMRILIQAKYKKELSFTKALEIMMDSYEMHELKND